VAEGRHSDENDVRSNTYLKSQAGLTPMQVSQFLRSEQEHAVAGSRMCLHPHHESQLAVPVTKVQKPLMVAFWGKLLKDLTVSLLLCGWFHKDDLSETRGSRHLLHTVQYELQHWSAVLGFCNNPECQAWGTVAPSF
jgi:hypothetical protein